LAGSVLLDTCAAIWLMNGDPMSQQSRAAISAAQVENLGLYVSPISAWEIGTLTARNRIQLALDPETWFERLLELPSLRLAPMAPRVLIASSFLPGSPPRDPADRIIAATARTFGHTLITRNGELAMYATGGHLDLIGC
jgi:PIN domain nuclease of toxin-antitoxin system